MVGATEVSAWRAWGMAIRPQTLPAGIAPVVVGAAVAVADNLFAAGPAIAALVGALLIQIGTNLANDYYDAMRGVDTAEREGFTRVTQAGLLAPAQVKSGMIATFVLAIVVGLYLVWIGGIPILVIGLVSIVCGIAYAGGPLPYGSYGLGDLFVFVFFGLVAVTGTYYVQAAAHLADPVPLWIPPDTITVDVIIASIAIAALATAILVVNNLRDIETDAAAGKRTLAVLVGARLTRLEFLGLLVIAYAVPFVLMRRDWSVLVLLPWLSAPLAALVARSVCTTDPGPRLNVALERAGQLLLIFALLFAGGLILG